MRKRALPFGWYPGSETGIQDFLNSPEPDKSSSEVLQNAVAGVVPHAGWSFCGSMILSVFRSFPRNPDTVVVLGGHNPPGGSLICYPEPSWEFPTGRMEQDDELVRMTDVAVEGLYQTIGEHHGDNTVEVVMAMAAALFPGARWAGWRIPADENAVDFGKALRGTVETLGRNAIVVGSTDLTHYGANFGFAPPESLENPVEWVAERDARVLEALVLFEEERALTLAREDRSACSPGGAVAAASYARSAGAVSGRLLDYRSSYDIHPSDSFVGYGAVIWE